MPLKFKAIDVHANLIKINELFIWCMAIGCRSNKYWNEYFCNFSCLIELTRRRFTVRKPSLSYTIDNCVSLEQIFCLLLSYIVTANEMPKAREIHFPKQIGSQLIRFINGLVNEQGKKPIKACECSLFTHKLCRRNEISMNTVWQKMMWCVFDTKITTMPTCDYQQNHVWKNYGPAVTYLKYTMFR